MGNSITILGIGVRRAVHLGTGLHEAVLRDDHDLAKKLIGCGAPVDAKAVDPDIDPAGGTPLHVAAGKGNVGMVQLLVAEGADKDAVNCLWQTPLVLAAMEGHHAVAEALLAAGADASHRWRYHTALYYAAMYGHMGVLSEFIKHGVDVNDAGSVMGRDGTAALHRAATNNKPDAIGILVTAGVDTEVRDDARCTPIHFAAKGFCLQAAMALLNHGADVNARDICGNTPLHAAARQAWKPGAVEMVDLLLRWGADETATDHLRRTPADLAGEKCPARQYVSGVERVRKLLANAPVARAWRRRRLIVASRARPHMVLLRTSTQLPREWMDLMGRVLGLVEEGVFRTIVCYV